MGLLSTTHIHKTQKEYVPYAKNITINEHKAPTDESVKLFNELQVKAKENILKTIIINENHLNAVVIYFQDDFLYNRLIVMIKFKINNNEHVFTDYMNKSEICQELSNKYYGLGGIIPFEFLHKRYAELIALELMNQCPDYQLIAGKLK